MMELLAFGVISFFTAWVVFFGGAERLEGTITSAFLIEALAPRWHAAGIKVYVGISWVGVLIWFWFL
jgi:hypothetical protein